METQLILKKLIAKEISEEEALEKIEKAEKEKIRQKIGEMLILKESQIVHLEILKRKNPWLDKLIKKLHLRLEKQDEIGYKVKFYKMLKFVKQVRELQKKYFKTRKAEYKNEAIKQERRLDKAVEAYLNQKQIEI